MTAAAGSAGTAGRGYRVPPKVGRHRAPVRLWPVAVSASVVGAAGLTAALGVSVAPHAELSSVTALPSEVADYPTARGADIVPGPLELPTIVPSDAPVWDESKGRVIVDGQPLRTPTAPVIPVQAAAPSSESIPEPEPVGEPPADVPTSAAEDTSPPDPSTPTDVVPPVVDPAPPTTDPTDPVLVEIIDDTTSPEPAPEPAP